MFKTNKCLSTLLVIKEKSKREGNEDRRPRILFGRIEYQ